MKTIVPDLILTYKSKRISLMIKKVQKKLFEISKTDKMDELLECQQHLVLLNSLKHELSKNLRNRIII